MPEKIPSVTKSTNEKLVKGKRGMPSFFAKQTLAFISLSFLLAILIPVANIFYIFPSFKQTITKNAEIEAERITLFFAKELLIDGKFPEEFSASDQKIQEMKQPLNFYKMRMFSPNGTIIYSTETEEIGLQNTKAYFQEIIASGQKFTKVVNKDVGKTQEGKLSTIDVVEIYVPIMTGNSFMGAFELYYDITDRLKRLNKIISRVSVGIFAGIVALLIIVNLFALQERKKIELTGTHLSFVNRSPLIMMIMARMTSKFICLFNPDCSSALRYNSVIRAIHAGAQRLHE